MGLIFRRAVFDQNVLALDEACFLQTLAEPGDQVREVGERGVPQETNNRHRRLLPTRRERPRGCRAAECSQQLPPSDGDCHAPLPREVRKRRIPRHESAVPNSAAPGAGRRAPSRTVNALAVFTPNDGSSPTGLPFGPPLAAFEYGGVRNLEHSGDGPNAKPLLS